MVGYLEARSGGDSDDPSTEGRRIGRSLIPHCQSMPQELSRYKEKSLERPAYKIKQIKMQSPRAAQERHGARTKSRPYRTSSQLPILHSSLEPEPVTLLILEHGKYMFIAVIDYPAVFPREQGSPRSEQAAEHLPLKQLLLAPETDVVLRYF